MSKRFQGKVSVSSVPSVTNLDKVNLLVGSNLNMNIWQEGETFNAIADDTYVADCFNILHDATTAPNVTKDTDGSLLVTVKEANKQFAVCYFLFAKECDVFINDVVSISARAKASGLATVRMAVLSWTGTADSITSDVIATWNSGGTEPIWATNWTREGALVDITLTSSFAKFDSSNIEIDTGSAKQVAVVLYLDDADAAVNDTFSLSDLMLANSSTANATFPTPTLADADATKKYFVQLDEISASGSHNSVSESAICFMTVQFPYEMFKVPTSVRETNATLTGIGNQPNSENIGTRTCDVSATNSTGTIRSHFRGAEFSYDARL